MWTDAEDFTKGCGIFEARPIGSKMRKSRTIYSALCEKDGKLCIVESKKVITYEAFVKYLKDFKVKHALYLHQLMQTPSVSYSS